MKRAKKQIVRKIDWTKTPEYREAILLKVLRAIKAYGFEEWMRDELKGIGLSI